MTIAEFLAGRGIEPTPTNVEQFGVMLDAMEVYAVRNARYGDRVWRAEGWRGALFNLRQCVERAWVSLFDAGQEPRPPEELDNLIDSINYAGMAVRQAREGRRDGHWW